MTGLTWLTHTAVFDSISPHDASLYFTSLLLSTWNLPDSKTTHFSHSRYHPMISVSKYCQHSLLCLAASQLLQNIADSSYFVEVLTSESVVQKTRRLMMMSTWTTARVIGPGKSSTEPVSR